MQSKTFNILIIVLLLFSFSCKERITGPPIDTDTIKLTLIDVSVRETYFNLKVIHGKSNEIIRLYRNGTLIGSFSSAITDTILIDTALTENTLYRYQAILEFDGRPRVKSNELLTQTLFPTSHEFRWQTFQIGDGNSSFLQDVFIVNDTCIFTVGEIYQKDSTGQFETEPYNATWWDGYAWSKIRISFILDYITSVFIDSTIEVYSVFAPIPNDFWFVSSVGGVTKYRNKEWEMMNFHLIDGPGGANKIWGRSSGNMYFGAAIGRLTIWDGASWERLQSGTTTDINDVWGIVNPVSNKQEVYCAVSDSWEIKDRKILKITDTDHVDSVYWGMGRDIMSVWTNKGFPLYACGSGLFENSRGNWREINLGNNNFKNRIRGNGLNDIFVVDPFGIIAHYNGVDWRIVSTISNGGYISVYVKNDMVVAVGSGLGRGIVTMGKRT